MGSHPAKSRQESGGVWTVICPGKQHFANLLDSSRPAPGLLHTEEVTGSIPVSPTRSEAMWILIEFTTEAIPRRCGDRDWPAVLGGICLRGSITLTAWSWGRRTSRRKRTRSRCPPPGAATRLARAARGAALHARAAVLNGDDGPVSWFIEAWLGMRVTRGRIEAVSAALLEEGWDASIPEDPAHLLTDLRSRTARQARALRPIWDQAR
jgi:hypothetical protein